MERVLKFLPDSRVYELRDGKVTRVIETQGNLKALKKALDFSLAETFTVEINADSPAVLAMGMAANESRKMSQDGLDLIKSFEGLYLDAYLDPVGIWTIGYGHTGDVYGGMRITATEAEALLRRDVAEFEAAVTEAVQVPLKDHQFSALVSFCFNLGAGSLFESTLLKLLNQGDYQGAANEFPRWNKAGGQVLLGLTRRRQAERALFLGEPWQPLLDYHEVTARVLKLTEPYLEGNDVVLVQKALVKAGFQMAADGVFGPGTQQAIKAFQMQQGLNADGIVGEGTRQALGIA